MPTDGVANPRIKDKVYEPGWPGSESVGLPRHPWALHFFPHEMVGTRTRLMIFGPGYLALLFVATRGRRASLPRNRVVDRSDRSSLRRGSVARIRRNATN